MMLGLLGSSCCRLQLKLLPLLVVGLWTGLLPTHVAGVITSQGMRRQRQPEAEVREFEGWITGSPQDYIMSLVSKRRVGNGAGQSNQVVYEYDPYEVIKSNYVSQDLDSLTYKKGPYKGFPDKVMGMYILLADDTEKGYETNADWEPKLHPYQQQGANVLFFTFINPETMEIPRSFKKLAATRGTNADGAIPEDTLVIFAIGGYQYSIDPNPWHWLTSKQAAEDMAVEVARWRDLYGIDGVDLDLEEGAGSQKAAGPNMLHFIRKLKSIHPDLLVSQPTYGYPQVQAEIDVINGSWKPGGASTGLADSVGLMVYEGTQALIYVKNYAAGTSQWQGFPIKVDVPSNRILMGCKGSSSYASITSLAEEAVKRDLLGVMVWYCSVRNGLKYAETWDCSGRKDSEAGYVAAMSLYEQSSK